MGALLDDEGADPGSGETPDDGRLESAADGGAFAVAVPRGRGARRSSWFVTAAFAVLVVTIVVVAALTWRAQAATLRADAEASVAAVGELKSDEISMWLADNQAHAETLRASPRVVSAIDEWLTGASSERFTTGVVLLLSSFQRQHRYAYVGIVDPAGSLRRVVPTGAEQELTRATADAIEEARDRRAVANTDLVVYPDGRAGVEWVVPLYRGDGGAASYVGAIVLAADADVYLFPLVARWPLATTSGESNIVERRGDEVVLLNPPADSKVAPLSVALPLSRTESPAVMAVEGETGIVRGVDFRGNDVIADIRPIEGMPWHMVAKVDSAEILGPVERRGWLVILVAAGAVVIIGLALLVFVRGREARQRRETERELRALNLELEERVRHRTARLAAANAELEAFSYSVSHDLRAPLRHIGGFSELLRTQGAEQLDDTGRHYLDVITGSVERMATLIDELLTFSRAGRHEMRLERVDMDALIGRSVETLRPAVADRDVEWNIESLPTAWGDATMLGQVWTNLLDNAVKYTRDSHPARITVTGWSADAEVCYEVRDNGAGFDMQYVDKLFGVFQRLHNREEFEGVGIGLANVHRIVSRHGGRTWARGELGNGATFGFSLLLDRREG